MAGGRGLAGASKGEVRGVSFVTEPLMGEIRRICSAPVLSNEPLSEHTYFHIGGPADVMAVPSDGRELAELLSLTREGSVPIFVLGMGTNVLFSDRGFRGLIIKLGAGFTSISESGGDVIAGAGVRLSKLLNFCSSRGLSGLEPLTMIPGSVGGSVIGNSGGRDGDISDRLLWIKGISLSDSGPLFLDRSSIGFEYRRSNIQDDFLITEAAFGLDKISAEAVRSRMKGIADYRKSSQPVGRWSAGCIFRNPPGESAGRLIDISGCKGMREGDAVVSEVHANFIINQGKASATDVINLIDKVRERVRESTGTVLALEVEVVGEEI